MWISGLLAAATWSAPASAAEPIFLPDFTPTAQSEFAISVMLQGLVIDRLLEHGYLVLTGDAVGRSFGAERVIDCAKRPECPGDLMDELPARVAVVVAVTRTPSGLAGVVRLYRPDAPQPVDELFLPIAGGEEAAFAEAILAHTAEIVDRLPPSPERALLEAAQIIAGELPPEEIDLGRTPAPSTSSRPTVPPPPPEPPPPSRYDHVTPHTGELAAILAGTGVGRRHVLGVETNFRMSGLAAREWVARTRPHAGRIAFELRGGVGMGDVDRVADVRVRTASGEPQASWYIEGPASARRVRGEVYLGYAPVAALDVGVVVGGQYGHRRVRTAVVSGAEHTDFPEQDVQALQIDVEPRLRLYLVRLGPVKPYLTTGAELRVFDDYQIVQPETVKYPQPLGGVIPGWHGGGGVMIDPAPVFGVFAEAGLTRHFGPLSAPQELTVGTWDDPRGELDGTQQITVSVVGGIQFRL